MQTAGRSEGYAQVRHREESQAHPSAYGEGTEAAVRRCWLPLYRYARCLLGDEHLAEEAVQESFLRTWRSLEKMEPQQVQPWLFGVARRCCLEMIRKRAQSSLHEAAAGQLRQAAGGEEIFETVRQAVDALEEPDRELIYLKHTAGMKCREIAEVTGLPLGTVTSALARAYQKLRVRLIGSQR